MSFLQDWFNGQLKQVVLELTNLSKVSSNSNIGTHFPDGASMSLMNKNDGIGTEDSLEQNIDLLE